MVYLYDACDQISDFCHQQLLRKMRRKISWTDRGKTVYLPPPSGNGGITIQKQQWLGHAVIVNHRQKKYRTKNSFGMIEMYSICCGNHNDSHYLLFTFQNWVTQTQTVISLIVSLALMKWVSEWLLFNANSAIFQLYHGENKLIFNEIYEVRYVLDQHAELDFYSASSLKQQSVGRHVAPLWHIILIRANQSLLFLLNAVCLAEKQQIPIL